MNNGDNLKMSAIINKLCLKDIVEKEQVLPNKIEASVKLDLKMTDRNNNIEMEMNK